MRAIAACALLALCASATACETMPDQDSSALETVRAVYDATAARDLERFVSLLDANVEWRLAENEDLPFEVDNPYIGPDAVVAKTAEVGQVLAFSHVVDEFFDAGDAIIVTGVYEGTYLPTGAEMTTPFVHVWRVRDGKVAAFQQYVDTAPVVRAAASDPAR